ncbi:TetR/AcrR family transcriptional regulator [Sphaerisporangium sp. NPDC051017]|uniref:TetR/AcrR family transcriptional regulator n=1 Tax=Sphaerisporangium sp. NPDC051017 TaxID=3154636 RepID=UPI003428642A
MGDPTATMEQIAEAVGVARTTVPRRFATREALDDALTRWATAQFAAAVDGAVSDAAPPRVVLYRVTADVLRVKIGWGYVMNRAGSSADPGISQVHADLLEECDRLFRRAQATGLLRSDDDIEWARTGPCWNGSRTITTRAPRPIRPAYLLPADGRTRTNWPPTSPRSSPT